MAVDQLTEEPEMGATFVDQTSDAALEDLGQVKRRLECVITALEHAGPDYAKAARLLLAGEAAIDHATARLAQTKTERHRSWQERQRLAREFLEVRTEETGRRFCVPVEVRHGGRIFRQVQDFRFTLERSRSLDGRHYGTIALVGDEPGPGTTMVPLQVLHRAFLDGVIVELEPRPAEAVSMDTAPRSGPALRLEEKSVGRLHLADERELSPTEASAAMSEAFSRLQSNSDQVERATSGEPVKGAE
jgi:exonuclease VII small subunit